MKVYVVVHAFVAEDCHVEATVLGVFRSQEAALARCDEHEDDRSYVAYGIEEHELQGEEVL